MRIQLEQFLAATMFLGTAGAIGVAVYTSQSGGFDAAIERIRGGDEEPLELPESDEEVAMNEHGPVHVVPSMPRGPTPAPPIIPDPEPVSADKVPPPFSEGG